MVIGSATSGGVPPPPPPPSVGTEGDGDGAPPPPVGDGEGDGDGEVEGDGDGGVTTVPPLPKVLALSSRAPPAEVLTLISLVPN